MKPDTKDQEAITRQPPKPPIYPVEVINAASRALMALTALCEGTTEDEIPPMVAEASASALRILHAGLASHEKAIRGEP